MSGGRRKSDFRSRVDVCAQNIFQLVVRDAVANWCRNWRTFALSLGSMIVLLLLTGLVIVGGLATQTLVQEEKSQALVFHVYLADGADAAQVEALRGRLAGDSQVRWVRYVSKEEALRAAQQRPGLPDLLSQSGGNPLPASLVVSVRDLGELDALRHDVASDPAVDPAYPSAYDADTSQALQTFVRITGITSSVMLLTLAVMCVAITAKAIRGEIAARWSSVVVMRVVGASGWALRGPFLIEGLLTGAVAGAIAAVMLVAPYWALWGAFGQTFTDILPGVGWGAVLGCGGLLLVVGLVLGPLAALVSWRALRT